MLLFLDPSLQFHKFSIDRFRQSNQASNSQFRSRTASFYQNPHARNMLYQALKRPRRIQQSLQSSLTSTLPPSNSGPSILIINQTPQFKVSGQNTDSNYRNQSLGYMSGGVSNNPNCGSNRSQILHFSDVPGIVSIAQAMGDLYDSYYSIFPNGTALQSQLNISSVLDTGVQIIQFYGVVRTFVMSVFENRDQIVQSVGFIQNKMLTLQTNEMDMLGFFELEDKYSNIKIKAFPFESLDGRFTYHYTTISQITTNFQINAQEVFSVTSNLLSYTDLFISTIDQLSDLGINQENTSFLGIVSDVDTVLNCLSTLADIEMELKNAVVSTKASLQNLVLFRNSISETLNNISNLADEYELVGTVAQTPYWMNSGILKSLVFMLVGFLAF